MRFLISVFLSVLLTSAALAGDDGRSLAIGGDAFRAGRSVSVSQMGRTDLFLAGEKVTAAADIAGTAHMAGRWVTLSGDAGGNAYMAGQDVTLNGAVAGNATLFGQEVTVQGPVAGNLRASGSELRIDSEIGGYALLAGERVTLNSVVAGDMALTARDVDFGPGARVGGTLTLYETTPGQLTVPASVAPEDRIERRKIKDRGPLEWGGGPEMVSWRGVLGGFLFGVLLVAGVAALIAALAPEMLAAMRRRILDRPGRTFGVGFVALSTLSGAGIVVALTGIGILLTPAFVLLALLAGFFGYVVGAYAFGVALLSAAGRTLPDSIGDRALAAGVGALVAGVIGLVPFLGWLFVLLMLLTGLGALAIRLLPDHMLGAPRY
ncbi:MAG: hypothetical protein P1U75_12980 [Antarcticimicrobium sp.]|uniref:hypothetical protein n=1 Tax=Antarcticimicrobium sp. TaxID=2824147 RepID=UPI0026229D98|nr:hypothetical protein [Antarcticimicrobium sp.]MDF1717567.1 hypothetical protein [Antarcticimicrobium sp.]